MGRVTESPPPLSLQGALVWEAIEPLRPVIDAKVFAFVEAREFARRDFPQSGTTYTGCRGT